MFQNVSKINSLVDVIKNWGLFPIMGPVPNKDMQIPKSQNPPQPSEVTIYMKDAHSAESNYISDFFFIYG